MYLATPAGVDVVITLGHRLEAREASAGGSPALLSHYWYPIRIIRTLHPIIGTPFAFLVPSFAFPVPSFRIIVVGHRRKAR